MDVIKHFNPSQYIYVGNKRQIGRMIRKMRSRKKEIINQVGIQNIVNLNEFAFQRSKAKKESIEDVMCNCSTTL